MNPSEAEEHLRVIRRLMERATIYRAISAPTALVGGLVSLVVGALLHFRHLELRGRPSDSEHTVFLCAWGGVLLLTCLANLWFLSQEAKKRGGAFLSPGMRKALGALFPAFLAAGVITAMAAWHHAAMALPLVWMVFYGLALLSASQFSPQAIPRLGWAFLLCGLAGVVMIATQSMPQLLSSPHLIMALTFGGLHLLYAILTWSTTERDNAAHV